MSPFTLLKLLLLCTVPGICAAQNLLPNADFTAGNTGFSSAYNYIAPPATDPGAGSYTVGTDNRAFNPNFPVSFGDHTTGTGNYLIVDGATTPNLPCWEHTATGLQRNRNYTFSFWLLNAVSESRARIQVSANGTDAGPAFSNPVDAGAWQLNTVTVNTGSTTQLVLRLRNLNLASSGNDFGIDDVSLLLQTTADVSSTLAGPAAVGAGQSAGPYTVTFRNAGPGTANQVTQTVTLPAGASLTAAQLAALPSGATYNGAGRTINFGTAGTLPAASPNSFSFSFTAPPTTGSVTLTSAVTTTSLQNPNTNADQTTLALTVSAAAAPPTGCRGSYATGTASSGLSADYYAGYFNDDLGFFGTATPALTRIDPQLNYTDARTNSATGWGPIIPPATRASTDPNSADYLNPELFSARYRGSIYLQAAGEYTFYLTSDDASNLWIDGAALAPTNANRLIDNSGLHGPQLRQGTATLSAGLHNVLVYFGENGGGNVLTLEYSGGPANLPQQVVPNSILCAGATALPPTATAVTNAPAVSNTANNTLILPLAGNDPNSGGSVTGFIIATLPAANAGILYLGNRALVAGQQLTAAEASTLTFDPERGFVGNATFLFHAVNNLGQRSNVPATYTIPVTALTADLTTTLSGPMTLGAGISSGTYVVTFRNNGPQSATQVTQVVTLPAGATMTGAQTAALPGSASYNSSANTITFRTVPVLRSSDENTFTFSFTAPTTLGQATVSSNVAGSTSQGDNTAPDRAQVTVNVVPGNFFVTNDDSNEVPANTPKSGNLILNDANPANLANDAFTAQVVSNPTNGTLVLNANGNYTYTPAPGYLGPDSFSYRVNVPGATPPNSNVASVTLNVYDANQVCLSGTGTNLLANPSFTNGNTGFSSRYGYAGSGANSLVPEGLYMVGTDANAYHPSFTGNGRTGPGDMFMIVNGSQDLSIVYQQTVAVQPNRYYTFSAYATSVNPGSPAQLGFVINGKSTSTVTELPTTVNSYVRISDLWFSGSSTSAVVEIRDVNKVRGGNDFGLDDLYIGTCTVSLRSNNVTNRRVSNQAPPVVLSPLSATAISGPPVGSFTIQTLPDAASGILYLDGAPVVPGQVIPRNQANQLVFAPRPGFAGNAVFTYSATDTSGSGSVNTATFTIPMGAPLPVELVAFTARAAANRDTHLTWRTASEKNNDHFDVERSADGQTFARVATVAGQGNSSSPTAYAYTDANAALRGRTLYYRLRQVDTDGTTAFSPVQTVRFETVPALAFYPNPTAGPATLDLSTLPIGTYQVTLVDATGRQVLSQALAGAEAHPLLLDQLAPGTYLLVVRGSGLKVSQRVVRE